MFYSASTGGFYSREIHDKSIPDDAVEITEKLHAELLEGQSKGKRITADEKGMPRLIEPAPASLETLAVIERAWRDSELRTTDGMVFRHRDEAEVGANTSLTPLQYSGLQTYRQALRGWTDAKEFPQKTARPTAPDWLNS